MNFRPITLALILGLVSSFAGAQEMPAGAAGMPPGMPAGSKTMFKKGGIGTLGSMSMELPSVGLAYLPIDHMQVGMSLGLVYDGNGILLDPASSPYTGVRLPNNFWRASVLLAVEYMVHDSYPFAMGPQFAIIGSFAPGNALDTVVLNPAWGFWYAPFNAPIGIGSSLGVNIVLSKGREPVVSLSTPAVRLVYVFN